MDLREALAELDSYTHVGSDKTQPAVVHLGNVKTELEGVPSGLIVRVSGSGQSLPTVAWIALLDPDVTTSAKRGIYLVYLRSVDGKSIYLSLNQGVTWHLEQADKLGLKGVKSQASASEKLRQEDGLIRSALDPAGDRFHDIINLGNSRTKVWLPEAYEAGNICAFKYDAKSLPETEDLIADLEVMNRLYVSAVEAKADLVRSGNVLSPVTDSPTNDTRIGEFRPKDSSDYFVQIRQHEQRKHRRHEALIRDFGVRVEQLGYRPDTDVHPRDLLVWEDSATRIWLVEAKTVGTSAIRAVRDAISQLFEYKHFYHPDDSETRLLALFSDDIGGAYEELLASLDIEFVIKTTDGWRASAGASGLVFD